VTEPSSTTSTSSDLHGTSVGQIPATGGRARQYATDAERARAWRERQKARQMDTTDGGDMPVGPVLAEATLAVLLDRLGEVGRAHEAAVADLVGRAEDAIGTLADPEAVADALAGARAEAARQVAEAQERAVRASQAKAAAETAARAATAAQTEAEEAANGAWERAETLEGDLTSLRHALETVKAEAAELACLHVEEIEVVQAGHAGQLREERRHADDTIADIERTARAAVEEATAGRNRAEGIAAELRAELAAARRSADTALAAARDEAAAAHRDLTDQLVGRYQAERAAAQAKAEADTARAEIRAEGAHELADNRASEISRLVAQVDDLRAELSRARHDD